MFISDIVDDVCVPNVPDVLWHSELYDIRFLNYTSILEIIDSY